MLKNSENNGTEEIGLVTPTPGPTLFLSLLKINEVVFIPVLTSHFYYARCNYNK